MCKPNDISNLGNMNRIGDWRYEYNWELGNMGWILDGLPSGDLEQLWKITTS